ncbi:MAG: hypothetical protein U5Q44_05310 [Dehalococcoidia bacterium]|nr:hypothetical protein [Dehalococcoidia bacterium]
MISPAFAGDIAQVDEAADGAAECGIDSARAPGGAGDAFEEIDDKDIDTGGGDITGLNAHFHDNETPAVGCWGRV